MSLPDYYKILEVDQSATQDQIRAAYKRAALKCHPDRVPNDSPERARRTKQFQEVNDAYFTLGDAGRRAEYDSTRRQYGDFSDAGSSAGDGGGAGQQPNFSSGSFPWSAFGFGGTSTGAQRAGSEAEFSEEQFGGAFEEMLREEGMAEDGGAKPTGKFWSLVGGLSGGAMGFIVANFPGAVAGAVAGNRLGAIRDSKGKSVYQVYQELPADDKARLLSQLAARVLTSAAGIS